MIMLQYPDKENDVKNGILLMLIWKEGKKKYD